VCSVISYDERPETIYSVSGPPIFVLDVVISSRENVVLCASRFSPSSRKTLDRPLCPRATMTAAAVRDAIDPREFVPAHKNGNRDRRYVYCCRKSRKRVVVPSRHLAVTSSSTSIRAITLFLFFVRVIVVPINHAQTERTG